MLPLLLPRLPELPAPPSELLDEPLDEPLMLPLLPAALEPVVMPALLVPPTAPVLVLVAGLDEAGELPDDAPVVLFPSLRPVPWSLPMLLPEPSRPALPSFDF
jgi:hypothetical protein